MKLLIDTHIFIWFVENSIKLNRTPRRIVEDKNNRIFISIASLWEISIKTAIGKLQIKGTFDSIKDDLKDNSIEILPITFAHTLENNRLPFHHRDPFDRIIVSQAIVENFDFISSDNIFDAYLTDKSVKRIF